MTELETVLAGLLQRVPHPNALRGHNRSAKYLAPHIERYGRRMYTSGRQNGDRSMFNHELIETALERGTESLREALNDAD